MTTTERRRDVVWIGVLAAAMGVAVYVGFSRLSPYILHYSTWDFWFESDPPAVADELLNRWGRNHLRTSHHPLFSLLVFPLVQLLRRLPGASPEIAFGLLLSGVAAAWIGLVFVTLRSMGLRRVDAGVFSLLAATSASVVFWLPVLEANAFGALSIILAIAVVALTEQGRAQPLWVVFLASLATVAFTSTNWMVGLLMLAAVLPLRKASAMALATIGVAAALWVLQRMIFPSAGFPLDLNTSAETEYLFNPEALGILQKCFGFFFHSIILPEMSSAYGYRLTIQGMRPGTGGLLSAVLAGAWLLLLLAATWETVRQRSHSKITAFLLAVIGGQLALTLVFGVETFFYSAHFGPLLVLFSATGALTRERRFIVPLAAMLALLTASNNISKFQIAAEAIKERYEDERRFSADLSALTDAKSLMLCGRQALAATGETGPSAETTLSAPPRNILLEDDPDTCYYQFDDSVTGRSGWILPYEHWSTEVIETFRRSGGRYFVTAYSYGIEKNPKLFLWLDQRFRRLGDGPKSRIYDLSAAVTKEGGR